ncbi:MAG: hypothetical protein GKR89_01545 [Candidatus Latescibacteria bacterium]|nr:hypothetical protein [Candidatus Latescibacterota bacterium]
MIKSGLWVVAGAALALGWTTAQAGEGKVKGYMFGDYYTVLSADEGEGKLPEKQNAFQMRRIYLTYEKDIDETFSTRLRYEAKDAGFGNDSKMNPFVKHAYLKWKKGLGGADVYIGLSGTPTWAITEKAWGYRAIEKTLLDLNKIGSSADLGVALKGKSGKLGYFFMVGNGPGQSTEDDNGKKVYGSLSMGAGDGITVVGYADFNMRPADQNQLTVKGLLAVQKENFHGGVEGFMRVNQEAAGPGEDGTLTGVSAFGAIGLADGLKGFGRVDMVSNDHLDTTDLLIIAGLDHSPAKNIHLMPNLYVQMPDGPDPNIQARVTFYYKY